jgi:hypothetical protein
MNYPASVLIDTWLELSHSRKSYNYYEALEMVRNKLFQYFDNIQEAEMYLYRVGYYND